VRCASARLSTQYHWLRVQKGLSVSGSMGASRPNSASGISREIIGGDTLNPRRNPSAGKYSSAPGLGVTEVIDRSRLLKRVTDLCTGAVSVVSVIGLVHPRQGGGYAGQR
jgi:hypothetical protein